MISQDFWNEISLFSRVLIPVSGGVDSTALFQLFQEQGIDFELIWNDTMRSLPSSRVTLCKYILNSGKQFYITHPVTPQNTITKLTKKAMKRIVDGDIKYNKKSIPCCWHLKEKPFLHWLRKHRSLDMLVISGIAGYEGWQRQAFLAGLRKKGTYLHYHITKDVWFAYPLRDYTKKQDGLNLKEYINNKAVRSGCYTCPIITLFEEAILKSNPEEKERMDRSKKVYNR